MLDAQTRICDQPRQKQNKRMGSGARGRSSTGRRRALIQSVRQSSPSFSSARRRSPWPLGVTRRASPALELKVPASWVAGRPTVPPSCMSVSRGGRVCPAPRAGHDGSAAMCHSCRGRRSLHPSSVVRSVASPAVAVTCVASGRRPECCLSAALAKVSWLSSACTTRLFLVLIRVGWA